MNKIKSILFHPILVFLVTAFVVVSAIIEHSFLALSVISVVLLVDNAIGTFSMWVSKRVHKAMALAFKAMVQQLTSEQRKSLEAEMKKGLLNKSEKTPTLKEVMTP